MKFKLSYILLGLSLVLGSCTKEETVLGSKNEGLEKPVVTVETNRITNYMVTFTIQADFESSYFAYAIMEGKDNVAPSPEKIITGEVSGSIQNEVFSTLDKTKVRVDFESAPDQDFQIFAVAMTKHGLLSEVTTHDVYVPDTEIPSIKQAYVEGNVLRLTFTEDIFLNEESYCQIQYVKWGIGVVTEAENLPLECIEVDGPTAYFNCPRKGNGAGYIISFPQGLFMDKSGNKARGVNSSLNTSTGYYTNLGWDDDAVDFTVESHYFKEGDADSWKNSGAAVQLTFPFDVYANTSLDHPVSIIYNENSGKEYAYADYSVSSDHRTVSVFLPRAPKGTFDVHFEWGALYDEWGNGNAEYEVSESDFKYSALDLKFGDYSVSSEKGTEFNINFRRLNAASVVMSADWFNFGKDVLNLTDGSTIMPELVGIVNYESGTITFDGTWIQKGAVASSNAFGLGFYYYGNDEKKMLVFWGSGDSGREPIVVKFTPEGQMTDVTYFDYSVHTTSTGGFIRGYDSIEEEGAVLTFVK